jgi:hypothetical protein
LGGLDTFTTEMKWKGKNKLLSGQKKLGTLKSVCWNIKLMAGELNLGRVLLVSFPRAATGGGEETV